MSNPFQEQLLKAGVVTKEQVQKVNKDKHRRKKQKAGKKAAPVDEAAVKARQLAEEKARRDRELNRKKEEQARNKAISLEINQLIRENRIERDAGCDIIYHFEHNQKVNSIHVDADMRRKIIDGSLGIGRIEGRYELVPRAVAEKIQQRNAKRIVLFSEQDEVVDEDDPYADYKIPDDLIW